jgi:uncharacterized protein (DUF433 family)
MSDPSQNYVYRTPDGGWRVTGTRISLDSIVHTYWEGQSAEEIISQFPTLTAEQVYGAIAFYLSRRGEIDAYMASQDGKWEQLRQASEARNGPLVSRLRGVRQQPAHPDKSA